MQSTKITISGIGEEEQDVMIACLAELGYDGFEQQDQQLLAYIGTKKFDREALETVTNGATYNVDVVAEQNWNELWESNFEPVIVEDFCTVRAHFHKMQVTTPYDIVITPKMSFGTGHHATTQLMMLMMREIGMTGKQVLDFGTGTGVLAILAEKMGASYILAVDNDDWSVTNTKENLDRNHCTLVTAIKVTDDYLPAIQTDVILANINRHILLQYMPQLYKNTKMGGTVIMSGLLVADKDIIQEAAGGVGLSFVKMRELNNWITIVYRKLAR